MTHHFPLIRTGIGQCSHRFLQQEFAKPCVIAGQIFEDLPGFQADSDGDVVFVALCNALTTLTHINIMEEIAQKLLEREGITDSEVYLKEALKTLGRQQITYVSLSLDAKRPDFYECIAPMRKNIARVLQIKEEQVGISSISADGLTDTSCGYGVGCIAVVTTKEG